MFQVSISTDELARALEDFAPSRIAPAPVPEHDSGGAVLPELVGISCQLKAAGLRWRHFPHKSAYLALSQYITSLADIVRILRRHGESVRLTQAARSLGLDVLGEGCYGAAIDISFLLRGESRSAVLKVSAAPDDSYPVWVEWCVQNPSRHVPEILAHGWVGGLFWTVIPKYEAVQHTRMDQVPDDGWRAESGTALDRFRNACIWDLHPGNIMFDPYLDSYIITDPVSKLLVPAPEAREMVGLQAIN